MVWLKDLFYLFYPRFCQICRKPLLHRETIICTGCTGKLPYTNFWEYDDNPVAQKFWGKAELAAACSLLYFRKGSKSRRLIHLLKYKGNRKVGYKLGFILGMFLKEQPTYSDVDFVVPVPLHPKKLRKRGFNQSTCIAEGIADAMKIRMSEKIIMRKVFTLSQTRKNRIERYENVRSIFEVTNPAMLTDKHILVVDDVITTGATIESCAVELLTSAPCRVSVVSIGTA